MALVKVAAGLAVLAWLLWTVEPREVIAALTDGDMATSSVGVLLLASAVGLQALRLQALAGGLGLTTTAAARITLVSYLFNQLLPGALGGEGYRAFQVRKLTDRWPAAIGLIAFERALGALALVIPGLLYLVLGSDRLLRLLSARGLDLRAPRAEFAALGITVGAVALLLGLALLARLEWRRSAGRRWAVELATAVRAVPSRRLLAALALSLTYHGLRLLAFDRLLAALGRHVAAPDLVFVLFVTLTISLVPLTLGALGVKEGAIVFSLSLFGVGREDALVVALLNRVVLLVSALSGLTLVALDRRAGRAQRRGRSASSR